MQSVSNLPAWIRIPKRPLQDLIKPVARYLVLSALLPALPVAASDPGPLERAALVSKRGAYSLEYVAVPAPIPLNEMFGLQVTVRERHKRAPAKHVSLEVDAGMLAHNHGMNVMPKIERLPDGTFRVRGMLFHMSGEWHLTFVIKRGLMRDKAETDVVVK
jgi:hypothetical protein